MKLPGAQRSLLITYCYYWPPPAEHYSTRSRVFSSSAHHPPNSLIAVPSLHAIFSPSIYLSHHSCTSPLFPQLASKYDSAIGHLGLSTEPAQGYGSAKEFWVTRVASTLVRSVSVVFPSPKVTFQPMPGLVFLSTPPSSSSSSSSSSSTPSVSHTPSFCIRTPAPLGLPWPPSLTMTPLSPKAWPSPGGATASVGLRVLYQDIYGTGAAPAQSDAFELHTWHVSQACQKQLSPTPTSRSPSPSPPFRSLTFCHHPSPPAKHLHPIVEELIVALTCLEPEELTHFALRHLAYAIRFSFLEAFVSGISTRCSPPTRPLLTEQKLFHRESLDLQPFPTRRLTLICLEQSLGVTDGHHQATRAKDLFLSRATCADFYSIYPYPPNELSGAAVEDHRRVTFGPAFPSSHLDIKVLPILPIKTSW
ncbi:uncharacterized protein CLUP02_12929 [Colletotrichum lupini]|uniref:Uncharacterized protein n=1 Tax=Colletotrichum lupini TaxID=145971 RepID=A0A9Q8T1F1_9PEZI|nr:uncharacterized protein CLUP02_12929 [Colletotrichum lupini]UQC87424.1 hypothetical protein CLUP02_12929 [Colletotrichum lupini]